MTDRTCSVDACEEPQVARGYCSKHYQHLRRLGLLPILARPQRCTECDVDGCGRPVRTDPWCNMHYKRWLKTGSVGSARPLKGLGLACSVDDCGSPALARGLCNKHYCRLTRRGSLDLPPAVGPVACAVAGCDRSACVRGWCSMHYKRWQKRGDLGGAVPLKANQPRTDDGLCSVDGCGRPFMARGWCNLHYMRWRRALLAGVATESYTAEEIAERDRWICGICRKRIGRTLRFPHSRSLSVDHIVPISHGGDDVRANVQPAHLICNIRKSNRGIDQLRLIG